MGGIPSRRGGLVPCWTVSGEEERCAWADCNTWKVPSWSVKWQKPSGKHGYDVIISNVISGMASWVLIPLYMGDFWNVWINGFVSWKFEFVMPWALKLFDSFPQNTWHSFFKKPFPCLVMPLLLWELGSILEFVTKFSVPHTRLIRRAQTAKKGWNHSPSRLLKSFHNFYIA